MAEGTKPADDAAAAPAAASPPPPAMRRNDISMTDMSDFDTGDNLYHVRKSRLIRLINWWQVASTYLPHLLLLALGVLVAQMCGEAWNNQDALREAMQSTLQTTSRDLFFDLGWKSTALFVVFVWWMSRGSAPLYMVDFSTFEPPEEWKVTHDQLAEIMRRQGCFTPESVSFMEKILSKSGTGQATAWPPGIIKCLENPDTPADRSVEAARTEAEIVIFDVVGSVLEKVGLTGKDIDFLIINCSLFSPTPSLCSMVSHKFGMRSDARTFNLSGMGCSAGVISLDLAKDLLKARPNSVALVVSTENLTQNLYHGNERSMLLQNTLFRVGGAAILLSNKWQDASRSKFKLLYTVRTQGAGKDAFEAVYESEDNLGNHGVRLSKEIVKVAGRAMEKNFTSLGPYVLPISEQYKVVKALALRKVTKALREMLEKRKSSLAKKVPIIAYYQPDFKRGIDHFCIHAGGRGVIDGIEKNLALQEHHTEPSRATLRDYGNTSSSSIWYEMKYIEEHSDLRRGQRILQVAFGSGFKCNSAVWICLNPPDRKQGA
ncbi:unnamed protein product [Ectocarpus sp. 6 AP-2014]